MNVPGASPGEEGKAGRLTENVRMGQLVFVGGRNETTRVRLAVLGDLEFGDATPLALSGDATPLALSRGWESQ